MALLIGYVLIVTAFSGLFCGRLCSVIVTALSGHLGFTGRLFYVIVTALPGHLGVSSRLSSVIVTALSGHLLGVTERL